MLVVFLPMKTSLTDSSTQIKHVNSTVKRRTLPQQGFNSASAHQRNDLIALLPHRAFISVQSIGLLGSTDASHSDKKGILQVESVVGVPVRPCKGRKVW